MLKVNARRAAKYKCPRHPMMQYGDWGKLPASCPSCHDIYKVAQAVAELDRRERAAERSIGYTTRKEVAAC